MSGTSHTGAWLLWTNIGETRISLSAGCSRTYLAPAACAAQSKLAVRRTPSFACASYMRARCVAKSGKSITLLRFRTGGGPPSSVSRKSTGVFLFARRISMHLAAACKRPRYSAIFFQTVRTGPWSLVG
eukprot:6190822-Pleurochrysis_carterae.AAC.3